MQLIDLQTERSSQQAMILVSLNYLSNPSPVPKAAFNKFTGHSSHVTSVMFTKNKIGD